VARESPRIRLGVPKANDRGFLRVRLAGRIVPVSPPDSPAVVVMMIAIGGGFVVSAFRKNLKLRRGMWHHGWSNPRAKEGWRDVSTVGRVLIFLIGLTALFRALEDILSWRH